MAAQDFSLPLPLHEEQFSQAMADSLIAQQLKDNGHVLRRRGKWLVCLACSRAKTSRKAEWWLRNACVGHKLPEQPTDHREPEVVEGSWLKVKKLRTKRLRFNKSVKRGNKKSLRHAFCKVQARAPVIGSTIQVSASNDLVPKWASKIHDSHVPMFAEGYSFCIACGATLSIWRRKSVLFRPCRAVGLESKVWKTNRLGKGLGIDNHLWPNGQPVSSQQKVIQL